LIFTDGGKLNNQHKVLRKNTKINFSRTEEEDEIYHEPFSSDQNIISVIMNAFPDEEGLHLIKKYTSIIGGRVVLCENFEDYLNQVDRLAFSDMILNSVNVCLEINNNVINIIQQNEIKSREKEMNPANIILNPGNLILPSNLGIPKIKFRNKNTFNKALVPFIVDFKQFKQVPISGNLNTSMDLLFDRNENSFYKEKWPLPDEFLMNKNVKTLQKKKAHPSFLIANELQFDFEIKRIEYDEYEIEDKEFILRFLENYPDLTIKVIKEFIIKNNKKITWDVYTLINNSENILKKPFAVLKLVFGNKIANNFNSKNFMHDEISIYEYIKQSENDSHLKLKFCVLPYNYREYFQILQNHLTGVINKTEFIIQIEKYMLRIPFYYKPYIKANLEKKNLWKLEENYLKLLDDENLNESVIEKIKAISTRESDKLNEMNKIYLKNKQLHISKMANCCGMHIYKFNRIQIEEKMNALKIQNKNLMNNRVRPSKTIENSYKEFLDNCSDFEIFVKKENAFSYLKNEATHTLNSKTENSVFPKPFVKFQSTFFSKDEVEISKMGDFYENVIKKTPLRNPYLFDYEVKEFKGDYFGNPFRRLKIDKEIYGNLNLDNPNINIKDGEILLINCETESEMGSKNLKSKEEIADEELSVYPGRERIPEVSSDLQKTKISVNQFSTVNEIIETENKLQNKKRRRFASYDEKTTIIMSSDDSSMKSNRSTKSARSESSSPNKLQMQLIDDDLMLEFKEMFGRSSADKYERNEIKINHNFNVDMNLIYDWKLKEKLKECNNIFKAYKCLDSKSLIDYAKSNNRNIIKIMDEIINKPFLFYTDLQRIKFLKKIKHLCELFGGNKFIIQQLNDRINELPIKNISI